MNERICLNCRHWFPEIGALKPKQRKMINGAMYGKCRATYVDQWGNVHYYNEGNLGYTPCSAEDDLGNLLFDAVPEG